MCPMVGLLVLRVVLDLPSRANGKRSAYVNAGDIRDLGSIPGSRRRPGGRRGNSLQYSSLENNIDIGACQATVHRIAKSKTQLKQLSTHTEQLYS